MAFLTSSHLVIFKKGSSVIRFIIRTYIIFYLVTTSVVNPSGLIIETNPASPSTAGICIILPLLDYGHVLHMTVSTKCFHYLNTVYCRALRFVSGCSRPTQHCKLYAKAECPSRNTKMYSLDGSGLQGSSCPSGSD